MKATPLSRCEKGPDSLGVPLLAVRAPTWHNSKRRRTDGSTEQQGRPRGDDGYPSAAARERELDEDVLAGMGIKSRGKGWRQWRTSRERVGIAWGAKIGERTRCGKLSEREIRLSGDTTLASELERLLEGVITA
jgi:hypothetical protein